MPSMNTCSRRRQTSSVCCSQRIYSSSVSTMMMKKKSKSKSEVDKVIQAPAVAIAQQQYTTTTSKRKRDDDDSRRVQTSPPIAAAAETRRKQVVQVERLGGLKLRFRFSENIHSSSGNIAPPAVPVVIKTKNLAVQEKITNDERNRCTVRSWRLEKESEAARSIKIINSFNIHSSSMSTGDIPPPVHVVQTNKLAVQEIISTADEERKMKLQREREAARRKIESITKTVDIPDNYYDTMLPLHQMFGRTQWVREAFSGVYNPKPLEKLGLFLKV